MSRVDILAAARRNPHNLTSQNLVGALRVFVHLSELRSFSSVAREKGISQPAVSRQLAALETRIGTKLFHRTTRRLTLTDDGCRLLEHAYRLLDALDNAEKALDRRIAGVSGIVRIAAPSGFARRNLAASVTRLLVAQPGIAIDLRLSDIPPDLAACGIDIAIAIGSRKTNHEVTTLRLATAEHRLFASNAYLERRGVPDHPRELKDHECITPMTDGAAEIWRLTGPDRKAVDVRVNGRLRCNADDAIHEAVRHDAGIGLLPETGLDEDVRAGRIRTVLADWRVPAKPIDLLYPARRPLAAPVRTVIDFLRAEFRPVP
jgi:DNA-binding transcriptional LysR family regulator